MLDACNNPTYVKNDLLARISRFSILPELKALIIKSSAETITLNNYSIDFILLGFGKVQVFILFVSGLVLMAAITETMGMSIIMPAAQCDLELTSSRKGIVNSISIVGNKTIFFM